MFVHAIEEIQKFTRPVHSIMRYYHNDFVQPGAATLFFINEEGVAITCKHVLDQLLNEHVINDNYRRFKEERDALSAPDEDYKNRLKELETKYQYLAPDAPAQLLNSMINCTDSIAYDYVPHPTLDLAVLKFKNVNQQYYTSYARFLKDGSQVKPGKYLCRFGYPFAEFTNYEYDIYTGDIAFNQTGNPYSPSFPIDGIVTRQVVEHGKVVGVELSTPGLRGQSGGPLFDTSGLIYGMQSQTVQYHLGFDEQNIEIISKGKRTHTVNHSFLNVGRCVHVDAIKEFLTGVGVKFYEQ